MKDTLSEAGIRSGQDFNSLTPDQLAAVSTEAASAYLAKHGKPMPADNARRTSASGMICCSGERRIPKREQQCTRRG